MIASMLISMWISNTATTLMLAPIAIGAARAMSGGGKADLALGGALTLGVAHAATIGGIGTPVGTPTNLIAIAFFERAGEPIAFIDWMARAIPIMLLMMPVAWLLLCLPLFGRKAHARFDAIGAVVKDALKALGPDHAPGGAHRHRVRAGRARVDDAHRIVKLPGLAGLTDTGIAIIGALALFFIPSGRGNGEKLIDWKTAERIPWGIAILFGGGLSLAAAMEATGLAAWIGDWIAGLDGVSAFGARRAARGDDHPGLRTRQQRRDAHLDAARRRRRRHRHRHAAAAAGVPGRARRELRLHAAGRDRAERDRLFVRHGDVEAHAGRRLRPQHRGHRVDHDVRDVA